MDQSQLSKNLRSLLMPSVIPRNSSNMSNPLGAGLTTSLTTSLPNSPSTPEKQITPPPPPSRAQLQSQVQIPDQVRIPTQPSQLGAFLPSFLTLKAQILHDLETNLA